MIDKRYWEFRHNLELQTKSKLDGLRSSLLYQLRNVDDIEFMIDELFKHHFSEYYDVTN